MQRAALLAGKRVAVAGTAAAAAHAATPGTSRCLERPPSKEVEVLPSKTNKEVAQELSACIVKEDDGWLLAEPVRREEVYSTLQELVECGVDAHPLALHGAPRAGSSASEDSIESIGHDADLLMEAADANRKARGSILLPKEFGDAVCDVLSDPDVQAQVLRALSNSPAFNEMMKRGPGCLPPAPATNIYAAPGTAAELGFDFDCESGSPISIPTALEALANGLKEAAAKAAGAAADFFANLGNKIRRTLFGLPNTPSDADKWVGAIVSAAMAVLAVIMLKRANVARAR